MARALPRTVAGRAVTVGVGGLAMAGLTVAGLTAAGPASATTTVAVSPEGSIQVTYRGNGHGHGLSQYGAYGAALAGRTTAQITAAYYPGTAQTTVHKGTLRVLLSGTGSTLTVAPAPSLTVTGSSATLPTSGVRRYRLVADSGSTLTLQRLATAEGSTWETVRSHVPTNAEFRRPGCLAIRVLRSDGTSTDYYCYLRAVRASTTGTSGGVRTVNVLGYNVYTQGVVPREMPASWSRAATDAQALAARTYAMYEKQHSAGRFYDLCDTSACQVYGGHRHYSASGSVLWTDLPRAAADTRNRVLTYRGSTIFAQYSASNGGWTTDGGQPYLKAGSDPYDPGRSGDPYVNATETVSTASLARYAGLATVTSIAITSRDGHGAWGGRVLSATVRGTTGTKTVTSRTLTGYDLQSAFGLGTTWLTVAAHR